MMLPILLNIVFLAGCIYFAVKAPFKLHVVGAVAVGFLGVVVVEFVSFAIIGKYVLQASKSVTIWVSVYMATVEELARLAIVVALFRTLADKGISYQTLVFVGISFGLCEYIFRVVGWSVSQTSIACGTGLSSMICQNTIALAPFAIHIINSVVYSIVLGVGEASRLSAFLYAFFVSIVIHSAHNIAYAATVASGGDIAAYNLAVIQLSGMLVGVILALSGVKIYREYLRRHNYNSMSNRPNGR